MIGYVKCFDSNKTISFKAIDNKLLKTYTTIWEKVSGLMNIEFDSEPVYGDNDKYIKTKIKIYRDKVNTNFHGKKVPKEKTAGKYLSLIMLDSVIRVNKKTKMENLINDDLESSSSDNETDSDSDNGTDNESDNETDNE